MLARSVQSCPLEMLFCRRRQIFYFNFFSQIVSLSRLKELHLLTQSLQYLLASKNVKSEKMTDLHVLRYIALVFK
jgi:hypothetical protein